MRYVSLAIYFVNTLLNVAIALSLFVKSLMFYFIIISVCKITNFSAFSNFFFTMS